MNLRVIKSETRHSNQYQVEHAKYYISVNIYPDFGCLHHVKLGCVTEVSQEHTAPIIRAEIMSIIGKSPTFTQCRISNKSDSSREFKISYKLRKSYVA
jgi:hypothetical protein